MFGKSLLAIAGGIFLTLYIYNNHYHGTNKKYLERLDETGVCFLTDMGWSISEMIEMNQKDICDILSLQENGLYIGEDYRWKIEGKRKHGGHLRIKKYKK